ncbi:ClpXP adapter SpxH family protein [Flavobacterium cerinum]|uniref:DsbA family protein n=1 Tax=Flavobacterium cerinum TaxID=2502784 RepID=A0A3S3Q801_9FLAO|nr:ClpXP adapter SpxH family protein [Flavobacterium cerinum]RWW92266.1 DsbA family protein [Flavobacterium cerinum]
MKDNKNPLLCDIETGICEIPAGKLTETKQGINPDNKPVKIIYFTDPICSSCWGVEPQLRKLKLEYGNEVTIEYHMGGLLPDWSYNSGGISKPSDVAHHWDEVSKYYDMPIDGDVWLENPLNSSYPPSIAFKAAQIQNEKKAIVFLRIIREMVFLEKKNIEKWEHLETAAKKAGLDPIQLKADFEGKAKELFYADLEMGKKLGVRGFPTFIFSNGTSDPITVYGFKPYSAFEDSVKKLYPTAAKTKIDSSWISLFHNYSTLTTREFSELSGKSRPESEKHLQSLADNNELHKLVTKNGVLWSKKDITK